MNDFVRFQLMQRLLVEGGLDTTLSAHREGDEAVFSLSVDLHKQTPEAMAKLAELTSDNQFAFTVGKDNVASLTQLHA